MNYPRISGLITRKNLALLGLALVVIWLTFLDSHSLANRYIWHQEYNQLTAEQENLNAEIERLKGELEGDLSVETVEKIAREDFAMKKADETVYRVEKAK